jgi:uncharacterized protein YjbI with pentapeptide repeats
VDLSNADLSFANFNYSTLKSTLFTGADMTLVDFDDVTLEDTVVKVFPRRIQ